MSLIIRGAVLVDGMVTPFVGERLRHRVAKTFLRGEEACDAASGTFTRRAARHIR